MATNGNNNKKTQMTSPKAPCRYPWLNRPDTRWKDGGEYHVDLIFDDDNSYLEEIQALAEELFAKEQANMKPAQKKTVKLVPVAKPVLDEEGEETGQSCLTFKTVASYVDKKTDQLKQVTVKLYDGAGKPVKKMPNIGNGSVLRVAFTPKLQVVKKEAFLSLYMNAVQLISLVEWSPDGSSYGFGADDSADYSGTDYEEDEEGMPGDENGGVDSDDF